MNTSRSILIMTKDRSFIVVGLILLSVGVLSNEWVLARIFSNDGVLGINNLVKIRVFNIFLIILASLVIHKLDFRASRWYSLVLMSFAAFALLNGYTIRMGYDYQIDFNEGWNVYHSIDAMAGQTLYDRQQTLTPINYPPISFYIIGFIGGITSEPLLSGRLVSFFSLLIISLIVGYIVKILGGEIFDSIFASIFCIALFVTLGRGYVGMYDPQLLGHVFIFVGLLIYIQNHSNLLLPAFLCSIGLFTKQNLIPIPIAISIDLIIRSRKDFLKWMVFLFLFLIGFAIVTSIVSGFDFIYQFFSIVTSRGYDIQRVNIWFKRLGIDMIIYLSISTPWLIQAFKDERSRIIPLYLIFAFFVGFITSSGDGADVNMFFDLFFGLSISLGMLLFYFRKTFHRFIPIGDLISIILPVVLILMIFIRVPYQIMNKGMINQFNTQEQSFLQDVSFLTTKSSPIICQNILLCYYSGKPFIFDPFLVNQDMLLGKIDERMVLDLLEEGYYKVVQLNYPLEENYLADLPYTSVTKSSHVFTENFLRALGNHYYLTRKTITGAYYEPKNVGGLEEQVDKEEQD